jgi:hypothetical protein
MEAEADRGNAATPPHYQEQLQMGQCDSHAQKIQNPSDNAVASDNLHASPILPQRIVFEPSPALPAQDESNRTAQSQRLAAGSSKKPVASLTKAAGVRKLPSQKTKAAEKRRQQEEEEATIMMLESQNNQMMMMCMFAAGMVVQRRQQQSSCGIM